MDVSVIIVNYNTKALTNSCIESVILNTAGIEYEIILVDNASTDGSKEVFSNDNRLKYIYLDENYGFGYGNNRGMEVAKGKYVFLLNSDTILRNNAIKEFYDYAECHDEKSIYGCYLHGEDGDYACSFFYYPAFTIKDFTKRILHMNKTLPVDYNDKEVECVSGADMFFARAAFEEVGGFDEHIFLYGEEGELQYRMKKAGYRSYIISRPQITHLEGKSLTPSLGKQAIKMRSHFFILKKHMNYPTYVMARIYYAINLGIRNVPNLFKKDGIEYYKTLISRVNL